MKLLRFLFAGAALVIASSANAVLLGFDAFPTATYLTNELLSEGVRFTPSSFEVRSDTFGGIVLQPSAPNTLAIAAGENRISFVDPSNPAIMATTSAVSFMNPGLVSSGGFYAGLHVTARNLDDVVIETIDIPYVGPLQSRGVFQSTFGSGGIHSIVFERIENPQGAGFVSIDELRFAPPTAVPEPSLALALISVVLIGAVRRSRNN